MLFGNRDIWRDIFLIDQICHTDFLKHKQISNNQKINILLKILKKYLDKIRMILIVRSYLVVIIKAIIIFGYLLYMLYVGLKIKMCNNLV